MREQPWAHSPWQHCEWRARDAVILAIEGEDPSPSDPPIAMAKNATLAQIIVNTHNRALKRGTDVVG